MRSFIAIDMPEKVRDILADLQSDLPAGNPTPPENLHLTLAFLGELVAGIEEDLHDALSALHEPAFDLHLSGVDTFGGNDPKVLFVGAQPNDALDRLHRKVRSQLHGAGIMLDRKRFRPHVTLARFRRRPSAPEMERLRLWLLAYSGFGLPPFPVTGFTLYQSTLARSGAIHDELARYPLMQR